MPLLSLRESELLADSNRRALAEKQPSGAYGSDFERWFEQDFLKVLRRPDAPQHRIPPLHRRSALKIFAAAPFALSEFFSRSADAAQPAPSGAVERRRSAMRKLIIVFLSGGASAKETFNPDPPGAPPELRGPMASIPTATRGVHFNETFPQLAQLTERFALIRSLDTGSPDHTPSMQTAILSGRETVSERIGGRSADGGVPYVLLNPGSTWNGLRSAFRMSNAFAPVWERTPGRFVAPQRGDISALEGRLRLLESFDNAEIHSPIAERMDRFRQTAVDLLRGGGRFFDALNLPEEDRARYGSSPVGDRILMAKRFADAGAGAVTVYEEPESVAWDRHSNIGPEYRRMNPPVDHAVAQLIREFDGCILLMGEFNRTPRVNGSAGRDHWQYGNCAILAGGRARGGAVVGRTNPLGDIVCGRVLQATNLSNTVRAACGDELSPTEPRIREMLQ